MGPAQSVFVGVFLPMPGTSGLAHIQSHRPIRQGVCFVMALFLGLCAVAQADYRVLHHFAGGAGDGAGPLGGLIQSGSMLCGMTARGGGNNIGVIFGMNTDGSEFQLLHSFVSGGADGSTPYGSLLQSGSTLYGMAGSENDTPHTGTLFQIGVDGTGFQVLHRLAGPPSDGRWPYDSLIQSGSSLYGMTVSGGSGDKSSSGGVWGGTVFRVNTDGTGYQILHHFAGGVNDGQWSAGNLTQSGTALYGMAYRGGGNNLGIVFKLNTNGTGFQLLHSFDGASDGSKPHGSLLLADSTLYGMTSGGGARDKGTLFKMNVDGTGFQLLHHFTGGANDGAGPYCSSLVLSGSVLYGMTPLGGAGNVGVVFQINADGTDFRVLHSFTGANGAKPYNSLLLSDQTLYGMTSEGGSRNRGVVFALDLPQTRLVPEQYPTIQAAIDAAQTGDVIMMAPGIYRENILITGQNLVLRSVDANDPNMTAVTILAGDETAPAVTLQDCTEPCLLAGLTLRGGSAGLRCVGGNPTIQGCRILENLGSGVELLGSACPVLENCIIADNIGFAVEAITSPPRGATPPTLTNCTVTQNIEGGISDTVTVRNSIVAFNGPATNTYQLARRGLQVSYSCIQDGYSGQGNIDADPLFVRLGRWIDSKDANDPDPVWIEGDYHLQSRAGCWDPNRLTWIRDEFTSPCIDAGNPNDDVASEPLLNGGRINMGAYGGTAQASKSPSVQFTETGQQLNRAIGRGVVLGDFNSDGSIDAFVVNQDDHRVYFGDGQGQFTDSGQRLSQAAGGGGKPALFDLNGDGRIEVITGSTVWLIDGQGRFSAQPLSIESSENIDLGTMEFADLNGDGYPDLFALRNYTASRVYLNDGHGRFRDTGQRLGDGTIGSGQLAQIALGDIDGDGSIDAVTGGWRWPPGNNGPCPNRVWLNDGAGNSHESGQLLDEGGSHVHGLALVDLNRDDSLDLVMGIQDTTRSGRIYLNDGTGRFIGGPNLGGAGGEGVAIDDFDGDGTLDVFMAHSTPPCRVWLNNGDGTLRDSGVRLGSTCSWDVAAGDLNADGRPDAFTANCIWISSGLTPAPAQVWLNTTPALSLPFRSSTAGEKGLWKE